MVLRKLVVACVSAALLAVAPHAAGAAPAQTTGSAPGVVFPCGPINPCPPPPTPPTANWEEFHLVLDGVNFVKNGDPIGSCVANGLEFGDESTSCVFPARIANRLQNGDLWMSDHASVSYTGSDPTYFQIDFSDGVSQIAGTLPSRGSNRFDYDVWKVAGFGEWKPTPYLPDRAPGTRGGPLAVNVEATTHFLPPRYGYTVHIDGYVNVLRSAPAQVPGSLFGS